MTPAYYAMRRILPVLCLAVLLVGCGRSDATQSQQEAATSTPETVNTLTAEERAAGWQLLFDGETTDGWHNYNADTLGAKWTVEDGTLTLTGRGGGDIVTDAAFSDFEFVMEWKISACGNNGLFFRAEEGHQRIWTVSPEYQLLDNTCADDNENPTHRAGANYDIYAPSEDATKPAGEWNETRLVVDGAQVQHYLNGVKVVEYEFWTNEWRQDVENSKFAPFEDYGMSKSGSIGLQDHGDQVWFRNIKIRPISNENASADV